MKKWLSVTLAASLFSGGLLAQAPKIVYEKYTLPNGLTVILHQDKSAPVVAVSALYHVGSKNEDTARTGFAHFFEHLMFEGSDNVKRGDFDKYTSNAVAITMPILRRTGLIILNCSQVTSLHWGSGWKAKECCMPRLKRLV